MRVLAEDDHLRGWYDINPRTAAVAVRKALVVGVPRPVIAVLAPPRIGERPKPLVSCDPLRGPLDHDICAGLPAVAPGRYGYEWGVLKVDVLLLTYSGAEREAAVAPDTYHGGHVRASVGAHGGQPVELGPVEQRLHGLPRGSRRRGVAEAIVDLSCHHAGVDRLPTANSSVINARLRGAQPRSSAAGSQVEVGQPVSARTSFGSEDELNLWFAGVAAEHDPHHRSHLLDLAFSVCTIVARLARPAAYADCTAGAHAPTARLSQ